jgi:hypothetical protein
MRPVPTLGQGDERSGQLSAQSTKMAAKTIYRIREAGVACVRTVD